MSRIFDIDSCLYDYVWDVKFPWGNDRTWIRAYIKHGVESVTLISYEGGFENDELWYKTNDLVLSMPAYIRLAKLGEAFTDHLSGPAPKKMCAQDDIYQPIVHRENNQKKRRKSTTELDYIPPKKK